MKCNIFEYLLPDWIAGRLPQEQARRMEAHHAGCAACQRAAATERALSQRWQQLPSPREVAPIWPRLVQRIEAAPPKRRIPLFPAWTVGGALASILLFGTLLWSHTPLPPPAGQSVTPQIPRVQVDERRIVQLASEIQDMPEGESDSYAAETQQDRQVMSHLVRQGGTN
jgi:anti-sigma factor RsiW